jgi:hypothetical protein
MLWVLDTICCIIAPNFMYSTVSFKNHSLCVTACVCLFGKAPTA